MYLNSIQTYFCKTFFTLIPLVANRFTHHVLTPSNDAVLLLTLVQARVPPFSPILVDPTLKQHEEHLTKESVNFQYYVL